MFKKVLIGLAVAVMVILIAGMLFLRFNKDPNYRLKKIALPVKEGMTEEVSMRYNSMLPVTGHSVVFEFKPSETAEYEFTLSDLAAAVGYTDYYLTKKFYLEMGIRLNDYIKREKIALAKVLLVTTDRSVQDIAVELNFSTRSFFTRVFKEEVGVSPAEFKERSRFQRTPGSEAETGSSGRRRRCSNM